MDAYFKTEIIDAYCRILLLTKQLGRVNYYSDAKAAELLKLKPGLGIRDVRLERGLENCDLCGNSMFREGYADFKLEPHAFVPPKLLGRADGPGLIDVYDAGAPAAACACPTPASSHAGNGNGKLATGSNGSLPAGDMEALVQRITDQVMAAMSGGGGSKNAGAC
jgi:L-fuculose-phosphate aldolase